MNPSLRLVFYKIYVEEIPGDGNNMKVRVAYEFECFPGTTKWINFIGDLVVSREILNSEDFVVGLSIFDLCGYNSCEGGTPEITVSGMYCKNRIDCGNRSFVFEVRRGEA